jgi:hypothetical protein
MRHVSAVTHILHQRQTISACRASSLFETSIAGRLPLLSRSQSYVPPATGPTLAFHQQAERQHVWNKNRASSAENLLHATEVTPEGGAKRQRVLGLGVPALPDAQSQRR